MTARDRMSLTAAVAVLLTCSALVPLFSSQPWVLPTVGAVALVALTSTGSRRAHLPDGLQPLAMLAVLLAYVVLLFAGSTLHHLLLPGSDTLLTFQELLRTAGADIQEYGPPVPPHRGLVLLVVLGVGAVAVVVDTIASLAGRAALAGLPLLVLFAVPSAVLTGGLGWLPFALGAAGWLAMLLAEGRDEVNRWGMPLQARVVGEPAGLSRVGRRIGGAALGVAVLVPALIPGLDTRLLDGGRGGGGGGEGSSRSITTYNPIVRLRGDLTLPEPVDVLRYTTTDPDPDYLRMTTLGVYDGKEWRQETLNGNLRENGLSQALPVPAGRSAGAAVRSVEALVDVLQLDAYWLPAPATPARVSVTGPWMWDAKSESVFATRTDTQEVEPYRVVANRVLPDSQQLESAGTAVPPEVQPYDTPVEVTAPVEALTARVVAGEASDYGKAAALQAFFQDDDERFEYSENVETGSSPDALQDFLEQRVGFCQQYATAMAAMLRVAGVPSRVAVGFTHGTRTADGSYLVTTEQAHAWPEAWIDGVGWLRFEPTPAVGGIEPPAYGEGAAGRPGGAEDTPEATPTPGGQENSTESALERKDRLEAEAAARAALARENGGAGQQDQAAGAGSGPPVRGLLIGAGVLLLAALPALLHLARRRVRWRTPRADAVWAQLREDAIDVGHDWSDAESPRQAVARLGAQRSLAPEARSALDRVARVVERARYARPGGEQHANALWSDSAAVRHGLRASVSRSRRLSALLLPSSTLRWLAARSGSACADVLDAADRGFTAVSRLVRRRPA